MSRGILPTDGYSYHRESLRPSLSLRLLAVDRLAKARPIFVQPEEYMLTYSFQNINIHTSCKHSHYYCHARKLRFAAILRLDLMLM
jgi:hypothetical protein